MATQWLTIISHLVALTLLILYTTPQVNHLEPWEKGSRKVAGQTGMCGGVSFIFYFINSLVHSFYSFISFIHSFIYLFILSFTHSLLCLIHTLILKTIYNYKYFPTTTQQVRGVGTGGIVSSAYCLLYKLYTLRLTRKQVLSTCSHHDSPFIRALGLLYIRFVCMC